MYGCPQSVMVDHVIGSAFCWARRCSAGALLLSMMISTCEAADERTPGLYVRASAVESSLDVDGMAATLRKSVFSTPPAEQFDDQRSTGWSIAAGWRFQRYFAVEAGFSDLGEKTLASSQDITIFATITNRTSTTTVIRGNTDIDVKSLHFAIVGSLPFGNWEPYIKLGVLNAETTGRSRTVTTFTTSLFTPDVSSTVTEGRNEVTASTTEALTAIGLGYTIAKHYGINLEAARIADLGGERTGEGHLTSLSLALEYRF
jgi:hypothetical protein